MFGAVRKSCPARASGIKAIEVQEGYDVENSKTATAYILNCIPVVPNYFRSSHQYNKTEIMMDNDA